MITLEEAAEQRHSVRSYIERPLEAETAAKLKEYIDEVNRESGLHIQLVENEPEAFSSNLAHYGSFSGVTNYIAVVGPKSRELGEKGGYYGEKIVLYAQQLGLNTCWAALTFKKVPGAFETGKGEKLLMVIALGYGKTQGTPHRSRPLSEFYECEGTPEKWFMDGVYAASLAPSAMNQQKFRFIPSGSQVKARAGLGFYSDTDLGIAKYHFEIGSKKDHSIWE